MGLICATAVVGLDGSENGVTYTLYKDGFSTGLILAGTGSPLSFGLMTAGVYTIQGIDDVTGCTNFMSGSADINNLPSVNAGADQSVCSDMNVNLTGNASFTGSTTWSTPGNGSFSNTGILNPVYTLGGADITAGNVMLVLSATGTGACSASTDRPSLLQ